ncbi:MAG TPA: uracil-DNA glycosylase, partial [Lacunisphaera sp.]
MSTRDQLLALNDELRRLKAGGQRAVSVTEEGLAQLRESVAAARTDAAAEVAAITTAPFRMTESPRPAAAAVAP